MGSKMGNFKVGDRAVVTADTTCHEIPLGTVVTLKDRHPVHSDAWTVSCFDSFVRECEIRDVEKILSDLKGSVRMKAIKTGYDQMNDPGSEYREYSVLELETYLSEQVLNAVVVSHGGRETAVFRGASEDLSNFYTQDLPLEDPGDAEGGDWTAREALSQVL